MNPATLIANLLLQAANDVPPSKVVILWVENGKRKLKIEKHVGETVIQIPRKTFIDFMLCQPNPKSV